MSELSVEKLKLMSKSQLDKVKDRPATSSDT